MQEFLASYEFRRIVGTIVICTIAILFLMRMFRNSILREMVAWWGVSIGVCSVSSILASGHFIPSWVSQILVLTVAVGLIINNVTSIRNPLRSSLKALEDLAEGRQLKQMENMGKYELLEMNESIMKLAKVLDSFLAEANTKSTSMKDQSQMVSTNAANIASEASLQAAAVEELSATIEQMTSAIASNMDNAAKAKDISDKSKSDMEQVLKLADQMLVAATEIREKITVVNKIAHLTNILSLNASVEAARAGDYGKGFSVVAGEVRKLAELSQGAAADITHLTEKTFKSAQDVTEMVSTTIDVVGKTSMLVNDIHNSAEEQRIGVGQISTSVQHLNVASQQNAAASEKLINASQEMMRGSLELQELVSTRKSA